MTEDEVDAKISEWHDTPVEWEDIVQSIGSRIAELFSPDFRNDICEPMAYQNIMEAVRNGVYNYYPLHEHLGWTWEQYKNGLKPA